MCERIERLAERERRGKIGGFSMRAAPASLSLALQGETWLWRRAIVLCSALEEVPRLEV